MLVVYMTVVFPPSPEDVIVSRDVTLLAVAVYTLISGVTFYRNAQPEFRRMRGWLEEGRSPTPDERGAVMRLPVLFARMTLVRWLLAVPLFAVPDLFASREFALEEAVTTLLAGLSTSAAVYLTSEWQLRPAFALALDRSAPPEARSLGIGPRLLLTWVLCSGVPILMVALIPVGREVTDPKDLIAPIWFAAGRGHGRGLHRHQARHAGRRPPGAPAAARDRRGLPGRPRRVRARRRRLRGRAACRRASTAWSPGCASASGCATSSAARSAPTWPARRSSAASRWAVRAARCRRCSSTSSARPRSPARDRPERVVALLNQFFEAVVGTVHEREGLVNKFEGDAALCVFGAPVAQRGPRAARARLRA